MTIFLRHNLLRSCIAHNRISIMRWKALLWITDLLSILIKNTVGVLRTEEVRFVQKNRLETASLPLIAAERISLRIWWSFSVETNTNCTFEGSWFLSFSERASSRAVALGVVDHTLATVEVIILQVILVNFSPSSVVVSKFLRLAFGPLLPFLILNLNYPYRSLWVLLRVLAKLPLAV